MKENLQRRGLIFLILPYLYQKGWRGTKDVYRESHTFNSEKSLSFAIHKDYVVRVFSVAIMS